MREEKSVPESRTAESESELTPALAAVMFRAVWNFAFSTSNLSKCKPLPRNLGLVGEHLQAIGKSPQEEEDRDQGDWEDRLPDGQGRGAREAPIRHRLSVRVDLGIGGSALLEDLLGSWFLAFSKHLDVLCYAQPEQELKRWRGRSVASPSRDGFRERSLKDGLSRFSKGCSADG